MSALLLLWPGTGAQLKKGREDLLKCQQECTLFHQNIHVCTFLTFRYFSSQVSGEIPGHKLRDQVDRTEESMFTS